MTAEAWYIVNPACGRLVRDIFPDKGHGPAIINGSQFHPEIQFCKQS